MLEAFRLICKTLFHKDPVHATEVFWNRLCRITRYVWDEIVETIWESFVLAMLCMLMTLLFCAVVLAGLGWVIHQAFGFGSSFIVEEFGVGEAVLLGMLTFLSLLFVYAIIYGAYKMITSVIRGFRLAYRHEMSDDPPAF